MTRRKHSRKRAARPLLHIATACLISWALSACGSGGTGGHVSPVTLASTYTGTEASGGIPAPLAVSIAQDGTQITGSWGNEAGGFADTGSLHGTVNGNSVIATFTSSIPGVGSCPVNITGGVSGGTISGNFSTTTGCAAPQSGKFTVQESSAPPNMAGSWSGMLNDNILGSGTISATVNQNGVSLTGLFTDSFGRLGQVFGVIIGSTVYFDLVPSMAEACTFSATGSLNGNTLSGTYNTVSCSVTDSGTFNFSL